MRPGLIANVTVALFVGLLMAGVAQAVPGWGVLNARHPPFT